MVGMLQIREVLFLLEILVSLWTPVDLRNWEGSDVCHFCRCKGSSLGTELANCSSVGMENIDLNYLPSSLVSLDLSNNYIENFPSSVLTALSSLKTLVMQNNVISSLCEVTLPEGFLPKLKHLNLRGNCVDLSDPKCLKTFSALADLIIETDQIFENSFMELTELLSLELVTSAQELPGGIFHPLNKLEKIHLEVENCQSLPGSIFTTAGMADNLTSLSLKGVNLILPDRQLLMGLKHLHSFHLVLDGAYTLPYDLFYEEHTGEGGLHTSNRYFLQKITIEGIETLPSGLFENLPMLKHLDISKCSVIPSDIINKNRLIKTIILRHNNFNEFPHMLLNTSQRVTSLDLSYNNIHGLQRENFSGMNKLQHLDLSDNAISIIKDGSFRDIGDTLMHLDLSQNPLCFLPPRIWSGLNVLKELHIDVMCDNGVFPDSFEALNNLENLNMNVTNIGSVPQNAFHNLELQRLTLNGVPIIGVDTDNINEIIPPESQILTNIQSNLQQLLMMGMFSGLRKYFVVQRESEVCGCNYYILLDIIRNELNDSLSEVKASCVDPDLIIDRVGNLPCDENLWEVTTLKTTAPISTPSPPVGIFETETTTTTSFTPIESTQLNDKPKTSTATSMFSTSTSKFSPTTPDESTSLSLKSDSPDNAKTVSSTFPPADYVISSTTKPIQTAIDMPYLTEKFTMSETPTAVKTQQTSTTTIPRSTSTSKPSTVTTTTTMPTSTTPSATTTPTTTSMPTTTTKSSTTTMPTTTTPSATNTPTTTTLPSTTTTLPSSTSSSTARTAVSSTISPTTTTSTTETDVKLPIPVITKLPSGELVSKDMIKETTKPSHNSLMASDDPKPTVHSTITTAKSRNNIPFINLNSIPPWKKNGKDHMQVIYWALPIGGLCLLSIIGVLIGCGVWASQSTKRNRTLAGQSGSYQGFSADDSYVFASPYASPTVIPMSPSGKAAAAKYGHSMARQSLVPQASPMVYNYDHRKQRNSKTPQNKSIVSSTPRQSIVSYMPQQNLPRQSIVTYIPQQNLRF